MDDIRKIQKAIVFAVKTHEVYRKQRRKNRDVSYISHPLAVAIILSRVSTDEDLICAGILHDTIEDSVPEKKVSFDMIKERFGLRTAQLVLDVTEENKALSWQERKKQAIDHIKSFSQESLLLKSADIITNLSELIGAYNKEGDRVFEVFNAPEPKKENIIKNSQNTISVIIDCWPENPLVSELRYLASELSRIENQKEES